MSREADPARYMLGQMHHAIVVIDHVSSKEFFEDERFQSAVFYNLIVLGEAAGDLLREYPRIASRAPSIPFHEARSLRNRLAHDYVGIDLYVIWETVIQHLPSFRSGVKELMASLDR